MGFYTRSEKRQEHPGCPPGTAVVEYARRAAKLLETKMPRQVSMRIVGVGGHPCTRRRGSHSAQGLAMVAPCLQFNFLV